MARRTGVLLLAILALVAGLLPVFATPGGGTAGPTHGGDTAGATMAIDSDGAGLVRAAILDADVGTLVSGEGIGKYQPPKSAFVLVEVRGIALALEHTLSGILDTPMAYPAEDEPDGNRWLPHHGLWPLPLYVIGWYFWYPGGAPVIGATFVGLAVLLLLDDWLSHALGIRTPGDIAFDWLMRRRSFRRMYIRFWWIVYR